MAERAPISQLDFAFIPEPLRLADRPELRAFPKRVTIGRPVRLPWGQNAIIAALYEPDLETYEEKEAVKHMMYPNAVHPRHYLKIEYNAEGLLYVCRKFDGESLVGFAADQDWGRLYVTVGRFGIEHEEGFRLFRDRKLPQPQ